MDSVIVTSRFRNPDFDFSNQRDYQQSNHILAREPGCIGKSRGVILSIITIVIVLTWNHHHQKHQKALLEFQKQSSDERQRFLQRLDHELKNPLNAIRAGLTNITYQPLEEYFTDEFAAVQAQVLRISRLVADLRKLATLEITPLEKTTVNMANLPTDILGVLEDQAVSEDRQLSLNVPNAPWLLLRSRETRTCCC
jgi:two-component system OmpR family sensor kinase